MKLICTSHVKKVDEKVRRFRLDKGSLYPAERMAFNNRRKYAQAKDIAWTCAAYALLATVCGTAGFEIRSHFQAYSADKVVDRPTVGDGSSMATDIIAKAQGKALDADSEKLIDARIKLFAADYFPDRELAGRNWIENYRTIAAEMLQPKNVDNHALQYGYQQLIGTIDSILDGRPLSMNLDDIKDLKSAAGLPASPSLPLQVNP